MGKADGDPLRIVGIGAGAWGSVFTTMLQDSYGHLRDKVVTNLQEAVWDADIVINGLPSTETREGEKQSCDVVLLSWILREYANARICGAEKWRKPLAEYFRQPNFIVWDNDSYVWWHWERWEKEIDWMALQGINLPLAFNGQETIWQKVFMNLNISMDDLNDFFGGPDFLAWACLGNLHGGWGGPLSQNWLNQQLILQKQILSRMLELGMTPVLPSFSGNVPAALKKKIPSANITRLGDWIGSSTQTQISGSHPKWKYV
ncbi:hypothetical protein Ddye_031802 [Dipteronia dyeriana]|uniref:Alpha-N-acetylglucosaminidase tim-barrel domain-containing protein n=1 Tax=Dipteronia dyeriana TaxID=168575 RepID=A0AAD9TJ11_9ROSI|nr:hypothetical protein Ddye_031802 [Dipteronia dyeriana]